VLVSPAPGTTYTLQYHYLVYFNYEDFGGREVLTASIGGEPVDTLNVDSDNSMDGHYRGVLHVLRQWTRLLCYSR
jgi:hypothetical protein